MIQRVMWFSITPSRSSRLAVLVKQPLTEGRHSRLFVSGNASGCSDSDPWSEAFGA